MRLLMVLVLGLAIGEQASGQSEWMYRINTGVSVNQIKQPQKNEKSVKTHDLGGIPLGVGLIREWSKSWSAMYNYSVLIDLPNQQISRQGLEAGLEWHILGGPKTFIQESDKVIFLSSSPFQLSLVMVVGTFNYTASTKDLAITVAGSIFEMRSGLHFRQSSYGMGFLATLLTYPASNSRLTSRGLEINLSKHLE